jgi:hypothetical protein
MCSKGWLLCCSNLGSPKPLPLCCSKSEDLRQPPSDVWGLAVAGFFSTGSSLHHPAQTSLIQVPRKSSKGGYSLAKADTPGPQCQFCCIPSLFKCLSTVQ